MVFVDYLFTGTASKSNWIGSLPYIYIIFKEREKLILMFEYKRPEHYLLVLTFDAFFSESVLTSSIGHDLVLDPDNASLISCLHFGEKGNIEENSYTDDKENKYYLLSFEGIKFDPILSRVTGGISV